MGMHWDEMEIPNATIEKDIDREAIDYFLKKAIEETKLRNRTCPILEIRTILRDGKVGAVCTDHQFDSVRFVV